MSTTSDLSFSELRYRRLFEAAHDGILILDPDTGKIVDVNPFLEHFLGYSKDEFLGKELFELGFLRDAAANRAAFSELREKGSIRYEDLPLATKDGRCLDVEFVSNLYQEGSRQVIQCNVRDISARKNAARALREADLKLSRHAADLEDLVSRRTAALVRKTAQLQLTAEELQRSNAQLETFVYTIAHDLRAPLRSMQGFAQLLGEERLTPTPPKGADYTKLIDAAAQKMDLLLHDLLAFSHVSQKAISLVPIPLGAVVHSAVSACEKEARACHAQITVAGPFLPAVLADSATLQQVLVNLIGNALKYVADRPRVQISAEERPDGMIRVWVEDNGIGIAPQFQERIFEVFQRLHTTAYPGTGIGLAIVQKGVERMGGRVGVISALGKGSQFWFEMAQANSRETACASAPPAP
jgi:PAS domain S-box-containing protein